MTRLADDVVAHLKEAAVWPALPPDRYDVRRVLGRGGMGTVYAAFDRRLEREVAIKVSNAPLRTSDLEARLQREARVLAQLEHPGIVPVHDAGELEDGRWYYVMKLVQGQTLPQHRAVLAGEAAILGVFERIAETVAFAHAAGIVHRDLKPSNVMVGPFGEVLVLDWGVAKILRETAELPSDFRPFSGSTSRSRSGSGPGTASGTRIGTPGFMAPEQQRGEAAETGPAADVYALGALLFWLLTGVEPAAPPGTTSGSGSGTLAGSVSRSLSGTQPRRLRAIVARCLADRPADRYPDAGALVADVARYRAGLAVEAHPESAVERAARVVYRYRAFILLVLAYLVMRALFAWAQRRPL